VFFLTSLFLAYSSIARTQKTVFDQALPEPPPLNAPQDASKEAPSASPGGEKPAAAAPASEAPSAAAPQAPQPEAPSAPANK
jgi:hypothetical protein